MKQRFKRIYNKRYYNNFIYRINYDFGIEKEANIERKHGMMIEDNENNGERLVGRQEGVNTMNGRKAHNSCDNYIDPCQERAV